MLLCQPFVIFQVPTLKPNAGGAMMISCHHDLEVTLSPAPNLVALQAWQYIWYAIPSLPVGTASLVRGSQEKDVCVCVKLPPLLGSLLIGIGCRYERALIKGAC